MSIGTGRQVNTDVIIIGYGGAGAVAAMTAHDSGVSTVILEKQKLPSHTSNTQMSLGVVLIPDNVADAEAYMRVAARSNPERPESQDLDEDIITVWAERSAAIKAWLESIGVGGMVVYADAGRNSNWPGNAAIKAYRLCGKNGDLLDGTGLFALLDAQIRERGIAVHWGTPALRLLTNSAGEVVGVAVGSADGPLAVHARRAVVLTCGGWECDVAALRSFLPVTPIAAGGNPGNTGDGLRMAQALGADLWHMAVMAGGLKLKFPEFPAAFEENLATGSFIIVDRNGRRFRSEMKLLGYSECWHLLQADTDALNWPRIPVFAIFDDARRQAGPIVHTTFGATGPLRMYEWSADNGAEIARGWLAREPTLEALARRLGIDPAGLVAEVSEFNAGCADGKDRLGRPLATMACLRQPPFYGVPLWPALNNTFGGPRRNARAQVVDVHGMPIPRLYSAGELGSIFVQYPQSGASLAECIAFGQIAGANAAAEPARLGRARNPVSRRDAGPLIGPG